MRKAFIHANIYKNDKDAFLIEDDKIVCVSTTEEVLKKITDQDEVIDLNGMFVLPGFVDSHMHLLELGFYLSCVQLSNCTSLEDMKDKLYNKCKEVKDNEWVIARGYNEEKFITEKTRPTKDFLDSISKEIPICVTRACGHSMSCNSKALELAGIQQEMEIEDGTIDFEEGILEEMAINIVHDAWPKPDESTLKEYVQKGITCANQFGVTTVGSDDFLSVTENYEKVLNVFEQLSFQQKLNIRVNEQCEFSSLEEFAKFLDEGYTFDVGNDFFRIGPLKLIADGSLGARSAAMKEPYHDDPTTKGVMNYSVDEMNAFILLANQYNMPTIVHCIGDKAVDDVLEAMEGNIYEGNPLHHGLVHCQILRKDQIEQIIQKKLACYFQSIFIDSDAKILTDRVGEKLAKTSYPFKTLYENTLASNGSDAPVELPNVLHGIELAITRTGMNQEECLSIDQAIDSYTIKGAEQMFMDDRIGKITEDYYADLVVLDRDITKIPTNEIHETKVMMTIMNGEIVFER